MNLHDGLKHYQNAAPYSERVSEIEKMASDVLLLIQQYDMNPPAAALDLARLFLIEVEKWKAGCLQQRMGNAIRNSDVEIWDAIRATTKSTDDVQMLLSIMRLRGFGSSRDGETGQQRAKVATSVLRFLWPKQWGVVDWRVAAMLGFLEKNQWDFEKSINEAKRCEARGLREVFDIIDEKGATAYNREYREISLQLNSTLPRAADVDMALFGLSLLVWPMPVSSSE